jgi:hypothetical protein
VVRGRLERHGRRRRRKAEDPDQRERRPLRRGEAQELLMQPVLPRLRARGRNCTRRRAGGPEQGEAWLDPFSQPVGEDPAGHVSGRLERSLGPPRGDDGQHAADLGLVPRDERLPRRPVAGGGPPGERAIGAETDGSDATDHAGGRVSILGRESLPLTGGGSTSRRGSLPAFCGSCGQSLPCP